MFVPTHSRDCLTKTFLTKCPDCQEPVFYFSCNCGTKVFFDGLGKPWPLHNCISYEMRNAITTLRIADRMSDDEIRQIVKKKAEELQWEGSEAALELLDSIIGRRRYQPKIVQVEDATGEIGGIIMSMNTQVSFRNRLKIDLSNIFAVGLAGDLLPDNKFTELFIRSNPDKENVSYEFRVFVKNEVRKHKPLIKGKAIMGYTKKIKTSLGSFWELDSYVVL